MNIKLKGKNQELYYRGLKYAYGLLSWPLRKRWIPGNGIISLLSRVRGEPQTPGCRPKMADNGTFCSSRQEEGSRPEAPEAECELRVIGLLHLSLNPHLAQCLAHIGV